MEGKEAGFRYSFSNINQVISISVLRFHYRTATVPIKNWFQPFTFPKNPNQSAFPCMLILVSLHWGNSALFVIFMVHRNTVPVWSIGVKPLLIVSFAAGHWNRAESCPNSALRLPRQRKDVPSPVHPGRNRYQYQHRTCTAHQ